MLKKLPLFPTLVFFVLTSFPILLVAQPVNDDCIDAITLTDVTNWCSAPAAFTNINASDSGLSATCFPNTQVNNDVWFAFTAEATTVNISINGDTGGANDGGTLEFPQFAIYTGTCTGLAQISCASDANNNNIIEIFQNGLAIGETYYIQVGARQANEGTFQLCINNFSQVPDPSSDCETGVILCDKSPFSVQNVTGVGLDVNEIGDVGCNTFSCQLDESGSAWYKWTCDQPGSLTFSLTPLNPVDDLDFILYELPNGVNNCDDKFDLRCMASGEVVGAPFDIWEPCTGATGLSLGEPDINETCGCDEGDNNFIDAIDMISGRSYALVVNNFSQSGSGFSVEFGGSGTFLGPEAAFTTNPTGDTLCIENSITFTDASTFVGGITGWEWDFGQGANPTNASTQGPHTVTYNTPGLKSIVLQVETSEGCVVTDITTIYVECCDGMFDIDETITNLLCPNEPIGAVDISVTNDNPPYNFEWSTGSTQEDILGLTPGQYVVTITDDITCDTIVSFDVLGPDEFDVDTIIGMPTCNGGMDGSITLDITGGTQPYEYSWNNGPFINDNFLENIPIGLYSVAIQDANSCDIELAIQVDELELQIDPQVIATTDPLCTGSSDGTITVNINNGLPPYQFDFNDGNGFVSANSIDGLPAGTYIVDALDANLCVGSFTFTLVDPPLLEVVLDAENISCFGAMDGTITALPTGGTGDYTFQWQQGPTTATISDLDVGTYSVTVTDDNGCTATAEASITQPPLLDITVDSVVNVICFGESTGLIDVVGIGGMPPYEFSLDGFTFQNSDIFNGLPAGDYTITVLDANGCTATVEATITQPTELVVDAGPDVDIELGFSTRLRAIANEFPVTFSWTPSESLSCDDCFNPEAFPVNTTTYTVTVINENGCPASDEVTVRVIKNRPLYIPNGFSPNGDGVNDGFTIFAGPAVSRILELKIFNRWGGLVFEADNFLPNDPSLGWDGMFKGQLSDIGVYAFYARVEFIDAEEVLVEGDVQLVR
jgi:gliding motility-associated-like protein